MTFASIPSCRDARCLSASAARIAARLRERPARAPRPAARTAATIQLLAVIAGTALGLALAPPRPAASPRAAGVSQPRPAAQSRAEHPAPAPVRIVGGVPQAGNCADQVWPYIARHCLTRVAMPPKGSAAVPAPQQAAASPQHASVGGAPADPPAATNAAAEAATIPPLAVAYLSPPSRSSAMDASDAQSPSGAWPRIAPRQYADGSLGEDATEPFVLGEPRPGYSRHTHRSRHRHGWGRRSFGFAFW